jgi:protein-histidine pros-kinase
MRDAPFGRYGLAIAASAIALVVTRLVPALAAGSPFLLSFAAVLLASWFGGLGPGLVCLTACAVGSVFLVLGGSVALTTFPKPLLLGGFVCVGGLIVVLTSARQRADRAREAAYGERERAEHAEQYVRAILEGAPDAMVIADVEGRIVLANSQVETLFGYRAAEVLGQPIERLVPDRFRDRHPGHRAAYCREPRPRPMGAGLALAARRKDGSEVPVEISLSPVRIEGNDLVIAAIRDITRRRVLEEERAQARDEVQRVRDDLTSMVVHDLKNPVNGIAMLARLGLRKAQDLPEGHRLRFAQIERSTREMMRLIQNLLEISKMEEGKMPMACEPVAVADVVEEVVGEYRPMADEAGKRLVVSLDPALPWAAADRALLRRVVVNLIANALRHSGSTEVRIEGDADPGEQAVVLRVIDHGRGIPEEDQDRIFEKFGSIRRSPASEPVTDTGLGLPFCKLAVERMGGAIRLTSATGGPTVFAVRLPAQRA